MCGIFGISSVEQVDMDMLKRSADTLAYRGPDAEGYYLNKDKTIALAHRRLAILDLTDAGRQPMCDAEKTLWIVFNGEIYNYRELREDLSGDGYIFSSTSDTEVLIYSYKKWGEGCLDRINGMFAFCIYDAARGTFFLARDRIGKKPLFYAFNRGNFVFASELKAILSSGYFAPDLNEEAVNFYFALGYIPGGMSIIRGVSKLPPGCCLECNLGTGAMSEKRYWDVPEFESAAIEDRAIEDIEYLLADSVKQRLISDVPLGAFLSGGVDSSLVVAFMRQVHNGEIKTFSVGFEGSRRSELQYSSLVARHFGTTHKEIIVRPQLAEDLEYVSGLMDEPIYDNSILPTYYLARNTRQDVTVALSGDGGDEIFGGYINYHSALRSRAIASYIPSFLKGTAGMMARRMPEGVFGKNTLYGISRGDKACFVYPPMIFKDHESRELFNADYIQRIDSAAAARYREKLMDKNYDFVNQMCYADIKTELADDILVKVDRASMFNSLEVRCPLLDYRIAEYSFRHIPGDMKIKGGIKKYLLKRIARKYLPRSLDIERKQGFDLPGDLLMKAHITERLLQFPKNDFISQQYIGELVKVQDRGKSYHWHKLFALYFFLRWLETWRG
jgi:asparagine synthase (glutamine-hydrolysing)